MTEKAYTFGSTIAKKLDYFAYPRTGSHFLWACFTGLFDLVFYENEYTYLPEAIQRFDELNPLSCYSLKLRQDGVPFQPVCIEANANGLHGEPVLRGNRTLILIRDPHPTVYSIIKTAGDRWGKNGHETIESIRDLYEKYTLFYKKAFSLANDDPASVFIIRYEDAIHDQGILEKIVAYVEVEPKLSCDFVHYWTSFERMTNNGEKTFYRQGDNEAWKKDEEWSSLVESAEVGSFKEFGY